LLPAGFGLRLDDDIRRPSPQILIGGYPLRILRLTPQGARMVDRWSSGEPVSPGPGAQALARRLRDSGIAHPRPPRTHRAREDVAVAIPVLNDPAGLSETLDALAVAGAGRVVVCDDGSAPVISLEPRTGVTLLRRASTGGPAAARNTAWRSCPAEIIVFLDANCRPTPGWLDALLPHFADPAVGAAAARVVPTADPGISRLLDVYETRRSPLDLGGHEAAVYPGSRVPFVPTAALAVRRRALEDLEGFDESLRFGEDVDLVWRLGDKGWRVRYEPSAAVTHPIRPTVSAWLRQRYNYGRSATELASRHGRRVAPLAVSAWSLGAWGLAGLGHPFAASAVMAGTTVALTRLGGRDRPTAMALAGIAMKGNLRAAGSIAEAVRRAWLPPAGAVLAALAGLASRRALTWSASIGVCLVGAPLSEWVADRPGCGPVAWTALRVVDDLAYQAGVWRGVVDRRSPAALLPRWWRG
jgi:mycofactocin system glycosyltransferase